VPLWSPLLLFTVGGRPAATILACVRERMICEECSCRAAPQFSLFAVSLPACLSTLPAVLRPARRICKAAGRAVLRPRTVLLHVVWDVPL